MRILTYSAVLAALVIFAAGFCPSLAADIPPNTLPGWTLKGDRADSYEIGMDEKTLREGRRTAYIKSKEPHIDGFATVMQIMSPQDYVGKRVELSGWLKTENVEELAGLWMRIDGDNGRVFGFDNMLNRPIKGTTDWKRYSVVLDVPKATREIHFGILLNGTGEVWASTMRLEKVSKDVPSTSIDEQPELEVEPANLDFDAKK
jgi:hypothetical protein